MSKFSTNKNKIRSIYENNEQNDNNLKIKENEIIDFFTEDHVFKSNKAIHDGGWISKATTWGSSDRNIKKGQPLASFVSIENEIDVFVPNFIAPFMKIMILVKAPPKVTSVGLLEYDQEDWQDGYTKVTANGNTIYESFIRPTVSTFFTQDDFDEGIVVASYRKQVTDEHSPNFGKYQVFYTPNLSRNIVIGFIGDDWRLFNLPTGANHYWNTMRLKINPDSYPHLIEASVQSVGYQQINTLKLTDSIISNIGIGKYRIFIDSKLIFSTPSKDVTVQEYTEYNDLYTYDGIDDDWDITEDRTTKNRSIYRPAGEDIEYKIRIDAINPLYSDETRKYKS